MRNGKTRVNTMIYIFYILSEIARKMNIKCDFTGDFRQKIWKKKRYLPAWEQLQMAGNPNPNANSVK